MLRTHNIAWRNFCSLFLNIVKKGMGVQTRRCTNPIFSHNFCYWLLLFLLREHLLLNFVTNKLPLKESEMTLLYSSQKDQEQTK